LDESNYEGCHTPKDQMNVEKNIVQPYWVPHNIMIDVKAVSEQTFEEAKQQRSMTAALGLKLANDLINSREEGSECANGNFIELGRKPGSKDGT